MAAPVGNKNASKDARLWGDMLRRKIAQSPDKLEKVANAVIEAAMAAEPWAVTELANRLDGKPVQQIAASHTFEGALAHELSNEQLAIIAAGGTLSDGDGQTETLQ